MTRLLPRAFEYGVRVYFVWSLLAGRMWITSGRRCEAFTSEPPVGRVVFLLGPLDRSGPFGFYRCLCGLKAKSVRAERPWSVSRCETKSIELKD